MEIFSPINLLQYFNTSFSNSLGLFIFRKIFNEMLLKGYDIRLKILDIKRIIAYSFFLLINATACIHAIAPYSMYYTPVAMYKMYFIQSQNVIFVLY